MSQRILNKSTIILYSPRPDPTWKAIYMPLSLLSIAAIPYQRRYDVIIVDWRDADSLEKLLQNCPGAICVGITAMTGYQISDGLKIARAVKEKFPAIPIVWGGWHPSLLPEQTVRNPLVDIVVRGQGERTFADVVETIRYGSSLAKIAGVTYKDNGKILNNPSRPLEDINHFPRLPFELIDVERYIFEDPYLGPRAIHYITSQGCPYRCGFCSEVDVSKRRWSGLSADRVLGDVRFLVGKYSITGLSVVDSNFFVDKERIRRICEGALKRGIKVKWGDLNGRTKQLSDFDRELWDLMEACGFKVMLVGSESGDAEVLEVADKDACVEDTFRFAKKCKERNVKVFFSNLVGIPRPGLVGPNSAKLINREIWATVEMINKLHILESRHRFLIFPYAPYPGTPLYMKALQLGFRPPRGLSDWGNFDLYASHIPWISKRQSRLIGVLQYVFLFLDRDSSMALRRVKNGWVRSLGALALKLFQYCAKMRWKAKFFSPFFDYWLYWAIRRNQRWV